MNPEMPSEKQAELAKTQGSEANTQKEEKPEFSKDLIIMDAAKYYPEVIEVFMDYGLHCIGCHISGFETVEEGANGHGIVGEEFENLLLDAREKIDESAKKLNN